MSREKGPCHPEGVARPGLGWRWGVGVGARPPFWIPDPDPNNNRGGSATRNFFENFNQSFKNLSYVKVYLCCPQSWPKNVNSLHYRFGQPVSVYLPVSVPISVADPDPGGKKA